VFREHGDMEGRDGSEDVASQSAHFISAPHLSTQSPSVRHNAASAAQVFPTVAVEFFRLLPKPFCRSSQKCFMTCEMNSFEPILQGSAQTGVRDLGRARNSLRPDTLHRPKVAALVRGLALTC